MQVNVTAYNYDMYHPSITLIPLNKILLTTPIIQAVKSRGIKIPHDFKKQPHEIYTIPLTRMNSIIMAIQDDIVLDPIVVQQYPNTSYYEIIDGRHRVAVSLLYRFPEIPAIIME